MPGIRLSATRRARSSGTTGRTTSSRRGAGHRAPEPVAAVALVARQGLFEVTDGHLPGARLRPVEHDARRGRHRGHRHRPADLGRDGGGRAGALPRAPGRPAGHGGDLHPLATSTTSAACTGSCPRRTSTPDGPDHRPGGLPRARGRPRTSTRHRDGPPGRLHVRRRARPRARRARSAPGSGQTTSTGTVGADRADRGHHPHRPGGDARRRADRLPDDARHRGAGRDELLLPRPPRAVHGRERHPQPAQPADPARRRWCATRTSGRATSPRRSSCSATTSDVVVRLPPLADLGHASGSSSS